MFQWNIQKPNIDVQILYSKKGSETLSQVLECFITINLKFSIDSEQYNATLPKNWTEFCRTMEFQFCYFYLTTLWTLKKKLLVQC